MEEMPPASGEIRLSLTWHYANVIIARYFKFGIEVRTLGILPIAEQSTKDAFCG